MPSIIVSLSLPARAASALALRRAGALDAPDRHIEFLLGEHLLHRRRHAAGRRSALAVLAALLHVAEAIASGSMCFASNMAYNSSNVST